MNSLRTCNFLHIPAVELQCVKASAPNKKQRVSVLCVRCDVAACKVYVDYHTYLVHYCPTHCPTLCLTLPHPSRTKLVQRKTLSGGIV